MRMEGEGGGKTCGGVSVRMEGEGGACGGGG